jgi:hypothetical protein
LRAVARGGHIRGGDQLNLALCQNSRSEDQSGCNAVSNEEACSKGQSDHCGQWNNEEDHGRGEGKGNLAGRRVASGDCG